MTYRLLNKELPLADAAHLCALAVMSKAPRAGKVKTRLAPPLRLDQTAALNICFLRDTTLNLDTIPGAAGLVCYTPVGDEALFHGLLPSSFALISQRGDGFGERLHAAAEDILACGFGAVCLIDSDSPTVPAASFEQAVRELSRPGDRVVLGPSHDGGYYLIGMKRAHREPLENISWSTSTVAEETRERCRTSGLELVELPLWYDVDDAATLAVLEDELLRGQKPPFAATDGFDATHTRHYLQALQVERAREAASRS